VRLPPAVWMYVYVCGSWQLARGGCGHLRPCVDAQQTAVGLEPAREIALSAYPRLAFI
jgi:hypothetical protein